MSDPSCNEVSTTTCTRGCWYWDYGGSREYFSCTPWSCSTTVVNPCTGGGGGGPSSYSYSTAEKNGFKYPPNSGYEDLYPKLTEYLKNKMPLLETNRKIIDAIMALTGLTESEIAEHFEWGNGPTIIVLQLDNYTPNTSENTLGLFDPTHPENLFIDLDLVLELENGSTMMNSDALIFLLGVTILHEYVHYGDYNQGVNNEIEEGDLFEESVYGTRVKRHNAHLILKRNQ